MRSLQLSKNRVGTATEDVSLGNQGRTLSEALLLRHFEQEHYSECLKVLSLLIGESPLEAKYFRSLGKVHAKLGSLDAAEVAYRREEQLLKIADNTKTSASVSRINALWAVESEDTSIFQLDGHTFAGLKTFERKGAELYGATSTCGGFFIRMCADPSHMDAFQAESELLSELSDCGCLSVPGIVASGRLPGRDLGGFAEGVVCYQVLKYTRADRGGFGYPDLVVALLEQKAAGVYNNLLSIRNVRYDSIELVCRFSDFSQSIRLTPELAALSAWDYIQWCQEREKERVATSGETSFLLMSAASQSWVWEGAQFKVAASQLFLKQRQEKLPEPSIQSIQTNHLLLEGSIAWDAQRAALAGYTFAQRERVLDIGCGMGAGVRYLASRGCEVCGLDSDPQQIRAARMTSNVESIPSDYRLHDLDYEGLNDIWDTVLLFSVFHHFKYTEQVAARVTRACRQRIFIECSTRELGYKWIGQWYWPKMAWDFETESALCKGLTEWFAGFELLGEGIESSFGRKIYCLVRKDRLDAGIEN